MAKGFSVFAVHSDRPKWRPFRPHQDGASARLFLGSDWIAQKPTKGHLKDLITRQSYPNPSSIFIQIPRRKSLVNSITAIMVAFSAIAVGALLAQAWALPKAAQDAVADSAIPTAASTSLPVAETQLDQLAQVAYDTTTQTVAGESGNQKRGQCSVRDLRLRRDWRTFSDADKKSYINSVLCLQKLPARTPSDIAPGARTRYDDFVATHINQTLQIHYTGTFLAWHRYFIWNFEQALRNECGYTGDYPYVQIY